jgi:hypothetical protein
MLPELLSLEDGYRVVFRLPVKSSSIGYSNTCNGFLPLSTLIEKQYKLWRLFAVRKYQKLVFWQVHVDRCVFG